MKYYYYKIKSRKHSNQKWVLKRDSLLSFDELVIGHEYCNGRFYFVPVELLMLYEDDNLIYEKR